MHAFLFLLAPIAALAKLHNVNVGQHGLTFTPDTVHAAKGDKIAFHIYPGHHGVAEGVYDKACSPKEDGFFSGYIDSLVGPAKKVWTLTVNDTAPTFIYCPTPVLHCQLGMVMAINPTEKETVANYQARSKKTLVSGQPKSTQGGEIKTESKSEQSSKFRIRGARWN